MQTLRLLAGLIDRLNVRLGALLRWLALLMVLMGAYNAVARYLTRYAGVSLSSNALNEAQWYLFSLIFLLGAAYGLKVDAHVRVDVLYGRLSRRAQGWIDLLGGLLFLLPFAAVMLWVSFPTVRNSWVIGEVSPDPGGLPRYPIKAVILVSFALLLLQGLAQVVRSVDRIRGEEIDGGPDGGATTGGDPLAEPGTEHSAGGHL
ncbi:MAG: TRAP transporter small permease subunit [Gemmatimonadales bacterium]|nr:MAG: TRAP transporter small permease subunit [Gemmatimonadales bacterium]